MVACLAMGIMLLLRLACSGLLVEGGSVWAWFWRCQHGSWCVG